MFINKVILCFVLMLCFVRQVYSDEQREAGASSSGFTFELLLNKLETIQHKLIESDQKLAELSKTIDQLTILQTESKAAMKEHRDHIDQKLTGLNETIDDKLAVLQSKSKSAWKVQRKYIDQKLSGLSETMVHHFTTLKSESNVMLEKNKESSDQKLNQLIETVDDKFKALLTQSNKTEQSVIVKHEQTQKEIQKLASKDGFILYKINSDLFYGNLSIPLTQIPLPSCKNKFFMQSGKYLIQPNTHATPFEAFCDQYVFGGGWLVFQYRFDGSIDFYRNWESYRNGFGSLEGEFWLGLEQLHRLTSARKYELLVELKDYSGVYKYARYDQFEIGSEAEKYALKKLGAYSGTAGDSLRMNLGMQFTTMDEDNGICWYGCNCGVEHKGAWWYWKCGNSNLNGIFKNAKGFTYMYWYDFKPAWDSMAYTRMSLREI